jgi:hypothetical protein
MAQPAPHTRFLTVPDGRVFSANGLGALVLISRTAAAENGSSLKVSRGLAGAPLLDGMGRTDAFARLPLT